MSQIGKETVPLCLKYKPESLDEVVGREDIIATIKAFMKQGYVPNLLFSGTQGSGKTLIAELYIKERLGKDRGYGSHLVIDASMNNGVDKVRDDIVTFMKARSVFEGHQKILLLDEFDYMTNPAQATLRRPIEIAMLNCQVIITCNYLDKIILPIQSRFTHFDFGSIPFEAVSKFISRIIKEEGISVDGNLESFILQIYKYGRGELRYILNNFMERARATHLLNQKLINDVCAENKSFIQKVISGHLNEAIQIAYQNPRGIFNGAINYLIDSDESGMKYSLRVRLAEMIVDTLRDMTNGMPYHIALKLLAHRLYVASQVATKKTDTEKIIDSNTPVPLKFGFKPTK